MGIKRAGGYIFKSWMGDHEPLHVHIWRGEAEIGRWDIEHQRPMDDFRVERRLRNALRTLGYLMENDDDEQETKR